MESGRVRHVTAKDGGLSVHFFTVHVIEFLAQLSRCKIQRLDVHLHPIQSLVFTMQITNEKNWFSMGVPGIRNSETF